LRAIAWLKPATQLAGLPAAMKLTKPFAASTEKENIDWQFIANLTIWLCLASNCFSEKVSRCFPGENGCLGPRF
jgi:hypothetical protein